MLTAAELAAMQATSATALPATCKVTRPSGPATFDPTTGLYTDPDPLHVYVGACRVRTLSAQTETQVGDLHENVGRYQVTLSAAVDGIDDVRVDDVLTVTDGTDAGLVDRPLRVIEVRWSEWMVDRRLVCEDRQVEP